MPTHNLCRVPDKCLSPLLSSSGHPERVQPWYFFWSREASTQTGENQYASLCSAISTVIQWQGWKVDQVSFITGARSIDKQDFRHNMKFFGVPEASISSLYSKLAMRTFDVYANILKWMYSTQGLLSSFFLGID